MIPAIWWSQAIWWSPAIWWSIGRMDFDNPKVYGDTFIFDGLVTLDWFLLGEENFKIKPPLSTHRFYHSQLSPNHIRNTTTTFCSLNLGHPGAGGCGPLPNKWLVFSWGIPVPWEPKQKLICEAWLKYFPSSESKKRSMNWRAYTLEA